MTVKLTGSSSGHVNLTAKAAAASNTLTLPDTASGELVALESNGDLNIDSNTLFVDASANKVGIGTTSPTVNTQIQSSGANSLLKLAGSTSGSGINDGLDVGINGSDGILWNRENGNILLATNNSERFRISPDGVVTKPYQPAFYARGTTTWTTVTDGTTITVPASDEEFDMGGHYDSTTNYRFTAPVVGKYFFFATLYTRLSTRPSTSSEYVSSHFHKNGVYVAGTSNIHHYYNNGDYDMANTIQRLMSLSANDYIELKLKPSGDDGQYYGKHVSWGGWLVS
tara:strand:- start:330 stop:1178 length:849 start_codon:yes stop_codon:yes gene_type:complete